MTQFQGEQDARGPGDFARGITDKFDDGDDQDDMVDDEDEPPRKNNKRKASSNKHGISADVAPHPVRSSLIHPDNID